MLQKLIKKINLNSTKNLLTLMRSLHSELNQLQIEELKTYGSNSNYNLENNKKRQYEIIDNLNLYQSKLPSDNKFIPNYN